MSNLKTIYGELTFKNLFAIFLYKHISFLEFFFFKFDFLSINLFKLEFLHIFHRFKLNINLNNINLKLF